MIVASAAEHAPMVAAHAEVTKTHPNAPGRGYTPQSRPVLPHPGLGNRPDRQNNGSNRQIPNQTGGRRIHMPGLNQAGNTGSRSPSRGCGMHSSLLQDGDPKSLQSPTEMLTTQPQRRSMTRVSSPVSSQLTLDVRDYTTSSKRLPGMPCLLAQADFLIFPHSTQS